VLYNIVIFSRECQVQRPFKKKKLVDIEGTKCSVKTTSGLATCWFIIKKREMLGLFVNSSDFLGFCTLE